MIAVRINAVIGDDRKLTIQLPDHVPPGEVEVVVRSNELTASTEKMPINAAREAARLKLAASGALVTDFDVPTDANRLSVEERMKLGTLSDNARSSLDLIDEDRGEW